MKQFFFTSLMIALSVINIFAQHSGPTEITIPELKAHISFLASDSLKGRKPGTKEGNIAAEYIRTQLENSGLILLAENGFQYFPVTTGVSLGKNNALSFENFDGKVEQDFVPLSFSSDGTVTAPVTFVGYGFDFKNDSLSWNDYQDLDASGKWCLILRGDPESDNPQSPYALYSSFRKKVLTAKDHGAAGVLFVSGEKFDKKDVLTDLFYDQSESDAGLPVIHLKRKVADDFLRETGGTVARLEAKIDTNKAPSSFMVGKELTATTEVSKIKVQTQNVVALLPTDNKAHKDEYLVIGAHYDHLGFGGPGSGSRRPDTVAVHNGADDNASGVAAIIEIAEKLAAAKKSLQRNIIVVAFGAEEMGTIGSRYFVRDPLFDLKKIKYMLNIDMIGRLDNDNKSLTIGGSGTAKGMESIIERAKKQVDLKVKLSPEGYGPSDHANFYANDIPVLFFFTGAHEDYHTPNDDTEFINFEGSKKIADFIYELTSYLANMEGTLAYQEAGPKTQPLGRRQFKVTLGIMPDVAATDSKGVGVTLVMKGRPAEQAGMQKGDIIVALEGKPVNDIYEYMNRLADFKVGQRISVEVMRAGKKVILIVEL